MRRGRHPRQLHPADVLYREMEEDAATDLALAELEISERVRHGGMVSADSMWEATPGGQLLSDTPASRLYNPARARREQEAAQQRQREAWARQREERQRQRAEREQQREQARIELERQHQEAIDRWAQEQAAASFHAEAERTRREVERLQRDAGYAAALAQSARLSAAALEKLRRDALFVSWNAVVMRNGWSEGEAAERWHDWLTGPPGLFG
jgi:flagellar biosynthesis GTPase FlhF